MTEKMKLVLAAVSFTCVLLILSGPLMGAVKISQSPNWPSWGPRIAVDSVGNIHVVWAEYYSDTAGDAFYAKYDIFSQTWSTPLNLSNSSRVRSPEMRCVGIDVDSFNNVYVVFQERGRVKMRIYSFLEGTWGSVSEIASGFHMVDSPRVAVDPNGNIFISWWDPEAPVVYTRARVGGVWENLKAISTGRAKFSDIAVGPSKVFACWTSLGASPPYLVYTSYRDTTFDAPWSPPQKVKPDIDKQQVPTIEVDDNNIGHVVYTPLFEVALVRRVDYAYWTGSAFTWPQPISQAVFLHYPSTSERGNNIYVCWQLGAFGNGTAVHINTKVGGVWTGETSIPDSQGCTLCDIATSPAQDQIYVVWDAYGEIWCNMGAVGTADPSNVAPVADFSVSPSSGLYPLEVTFDASASYDSDGDIIQYSWNFGDGAVGSGQVVKHVYTTWGTFAVTLAVRDNKNTSASRVKQVVVSRLYQPLNIRWSSKVDESLFQTRYVNQVTWERNPINDSFGVEITSHRIFRKKVGEPDTSYILVGEVSGGEYSFLDTKNAGRNTDVYTVTVRDSQGRESPITEGQGNAGTLSIQREPQVSPKRGKLAVSRSR